MNRLTVKEKRWNPILRVSTGILLLIAIVFAAIFWPNSSTSLLFFFGPQEEASTSTSIYIESGTENITVYIPVLLDEKGNLMEMHESPSSKSNLKTSVVDTEYGKALMINRSGFGDELFNWNEVPGEDTERFVKWLEGKGRTQQGEKLDIQKTGDGTVITVSGRMTASGRNSREFRLNETGVYEFYYVYNDIDDVTNEHSGEVLLAKEDNGQLNIYSRKYEINIEEKHGLLKEDKQVSEEFFSNFTITMSNYTSLEPFSEIKAWVYSDSEVEKFRFSYSRDPGNRINREILSISTDGWVHLNRGWQVVNLSSGIMCWD